MQSAQTLKVMLPGINEARNAFGKMLASNVPRNHIHFLAKRDGLPEDLPQASFEQKTDVTRAAVMGALLGGAIGLVVGAAAVILPLGEFQMEPVAIPAFAIASGVIGLWSATMVGVSKPHAGHEKFDQAFDDGKVLMIVNVAPDEVTRVEAELETLPHSTIERTPA